MSVDIFGRNLKREGGSRGPPGIGYKLSDDGQYDIDQKRLCNVADPKNSYDAVNLNTVQMEVKKMANAISKLRNDFNNLNEIMNLQRNVHKEIQRSKEKDSDNLKKVNEKLNRHDRDIENIKLIIQQISDNIHSADVDE